MTVHHGRDQWQRIRIAADRDGRIRGLDVDLLADMGAYLMLVTPGVPLLGAFMFPAIYKMDALRVQVHRRVHHQDAHRRLPRRGPARGDLRHRADHGRARRRAGHGPAGGAASGTGSSTRSSRTPRSPALTYDSGNYEAATARAKELFDYDALRRGAGRAERQRATRSGSASASRRSPRCAGWRRRGCSGSLAYGAGGWEHAVDPDAADRQGRGGHRVQRARPGSRDGVEPDRGRPARRAVRGHPGAARRHPGLAQGHGHLRLPLAGRRRHGPGRAPATRSIDEGQGDRRAHAGGRRRATSSSPTGRFQVARRPGEGPVRSRRSRWPPSPRTTCPTAWSRRWTPTPPTTRTTSPSRTAPTCARSRWTPRPAWSTIRSYVAVDDVGKVVNPLIVEGQVHGGIAQGIAPGAVRGGGLRRRRATCSPPRWPTTWCRPRPTCRPS